MTNSPVQLVALALALLALSGCGEDEDESSQQTTSTVDLSAPADGDFAFDRNAATTEAGEVTINFENPSPLPHDVVVEDEEGDEIARTELISEDRTSTTADLQPGTYTFYCDVPGHRQGGMEGTLTIE